MRVNPAETYRLEAYLWKADGERTLIEAERVQIGEITVSAYAATMEFRFLKDDSGSAFTLTTQTETLTED